MEVVDPDAFAFLEPRYRAALSGEDITFEIEIGGRAYDVRLAPVRRGGEITGGIVVSQDVTARKSADEVRALFSAIVESTADAMLSTTREGTITSWNTGAERLYGFRSDEVIGESLTMLVPEPKRTESRSLTETILAGGDVTDFETRRLRKDGTEIDVSLTLSPVRDGTGSITGVAGIVRDISSRKRDEELRRGLEQRLRESERRESLGLLAGGVAHDFNNLLVGMLGNADLALAELPAGAPARNRIDRILTAAERAGELTNQMLAYSGRGTFTVEPLHLSELGWGSCWRLRSRRRPGCASSSMPIFHSCRPTPPRSGRS